MVKRPLVLALLLAGGVLYGQQRSPQQILADIERHVAELRTALTESPTIVVPNGGDLAAAIAAAPAGAVLELEPGSMAFTGNFRARPNLTLRTRGLELPDRAPTLDECATMARVETPNNAAALAVPPDTDGVRLHRLRVSGPANDVILLGAGDGSQTTLDQAPRDIEIDQTCIFGPGAKNGIGLHAASTRITRTVIHDVARLGIESHAIAGYNGPGPYVIERNDILGSAIGILFGGDQPRVPFLVPADIQIRGNTIRKHEDLTGRNYAPKNAIECKACRRLTVQGNAIDRVVAAAQAGWGIVFTPSQYGGDPWAIVEDVVFEDNVLRNVGGVFNILGHGQNQTTAGRATLVSRNIAIRRNWLHCDRALGAHGTLAQFGNGPIDVAFEQNTIECNGDAFLRKSDATPMPGFRYTGNLQIVTGTYGIFIAGGLTRFSAAVMAQLPSAVIGGNAFVGAHATMRANLPDNLFIATSEGLVEDGYGLGAAAGYGRPR